MDISRWLLYQWIRNVDDKKIIIFGEGVRAEKIYHKLCLMDLEVDYFIEDKVEGDSVLCGCSVRNYYELLYEDIDKLGIVITKEENLEKIFAILPRIEWCMHNFLLLFRYNPLKNLYPIDPTLGYNIFGDIECPGFVLFGDRKSEYTIVTLGGSTTDAVYSASVKIKCWSEILSAKLKKEGISAKVLCGGVVDYKSSQELLKLIRDVIPIHPNMVITYDGYDDTYVIPDSFNQGYSFLNHHQKKLISLVCQIKKVGMLGDKYTFGIDSGWDSYITWKNSIKMMHSICEGYDIKHISVLQPSLCSQFGQLGEKSDQEILLHKRLPDEYRHSFERFYSVMDNDEWHPEWLKDLRTVFHGIDHIFYDTCHIWEKGNEIIAEKMLGFIREIL